MRARSRRTASLLAAAALVVPATLGVGTVSAAQASPLCFLTDTCKDSDSGDSDSAKKNPAPAGTVSPGMPTKPTDDPTSKPSEPGEPEPGPTDEPTDEPSDSASPEPTDPGGLGLSDPDDDGDDGDEDSDKKLDGKFPADAQRDDNAPVFTKTPAAMGSESLSFKGLKGISFVSVPTSDGGSIVTLKIQADEISVDGFSLTVKPPDEDFGLVTTADNMTLKGDVTVYIGSITATTKDGKSLTLGPDTPPAMDDVKPGLLRVTMGLVGATGDGIYYTNTDQELKEA
ncbi:hypothetical protein [Brevibacterium oceani]|uniref:hypothetical protein n=1 Tax=Brevibacterium oceani TaxID=358099 RepID=UPI001B33126B|nr:hypothetical protein [Brevibacterium oceani]